VSIYTEHFFTIFYSFDIPRELRRIPRERHKSNGFRPKNRKGMQSEQGYALLEAKRKHGKGVGESKSVSLAKTKEKFKIIIAKIKHNKRILKFYKIIK
jgi:hypothetical protein